MTDDQKDAVEVATAAFIAAVVLVIIMALFGLAPS